MPEFELTKNFPTTADNLSKLNFNVWGKFIFSSINPKSSFSIFIKEMEEKMGWLPLHEYKFDASRSRDYLVQANWALYCDNYLEGFHIPYVHPSLNEVLDYGNYETEVYTYSNLQIGIVERAEDILIYPRTIRIMENALLLIITGYSQTQCSISILGVYLSMWSILWVLNVLKSDFLPTFGNQNYWIRVQVLVWIV